MKKIIAIASLAVAFACTPGEKQTAKTAIDVASYGCMLANMDLPIPALLQACQIEQDLAPAVKHAIDDMKAQRTKYAAAMHCPAAPEPAPAQ